MTPCSGCCSGEKAILGAKTPAGKPLLYLHNAGTLLRCIREYCCIPDHGGLDGERMQHVGALPECHIDSASTDLGDIASNLATLGEPQ